MDALQRLVEIEAIHLLKARYWRYFDTKNWEAWLDLFLPDATLKADHATIWEDEIETLVLNGRDEMAGFLIPRSALRKTVHHGHSPEIEFQSETEATGIWAMEDILEYADFITHGHGHYYESYKKLNGEWRISTLHLKRLRLKNLPKADFPV